MAQSVEQQPWRQTPDAGEHLRLGILRSRAIVIADAAAQTGQQQTIVLDAAPFERDAATWHVHHLAFLGILDFIVITLDVETGDAQHSDNKL